MWCAVSRPHEHVERAAPESTRRRGGFREARFDFFGCFAGSPAACSSARAKQPRSRSGSPVLGRALANRPLAPGPLVLLLAAARHEVLRPAWLQAEGIDRVPAAEVEPDERPRPIARRLDPVAGQTVRLLSPFVESQRHAWVASAERHVDQPAILDLDQEQLVAERWVGAPVPEERLVCAEERRGEVELTQKPVEEVVQLVAEAAAAPHDDLLVEGRVFQDDRLPQRIDVQALIGYRQPVRHLQVAQHGGSRAGRSAVVDPFQVRVDFHRAHSTRA